MHDLDFRAVGAHGSNGPIVDQRPGYGFGFLSSAYLSEGIGEEPQAFMVGSGERLCESCRRQ